MKKELKAKISPDSSKFHFKPTKTVFQSLSICALIFSGFSLPASADEAQLLEAAGMLEDRGSGARIDMAGKLRMLSQRIPMTACNLVAGVEGDAAGTMLQGSVAEFQKIISALEYGDDSLGIFGAEEDRRVLRAVANVLEIWGPMYDAVNQPDVSAIDVPIVVEAADTSHELLKRAQALVDDVTGEHGGSAELGQSDAITIGIAGRQRMLAQRMSKNACLLAEGHVGEAAAAELKAAMETYDVSLNALRFGMAEAAIIEPPTAGIKDGLEEIAADWAVIQPRLEDIRTGGRLDMETRAALFHGLNGLTAKMNVVVGAYAEATKVDL